MPDYIETNPQQWLIDNKLNDLIITRADVNEHHVKYVSDALRDFARLVIEQTVETCSAHSDSEIDKYGAIVNMYNQFGL